MKASEKSVWVKKIGKMAGEEYSVDASRVLMVITFDRRQRRKSIRTVCVERIAGGLFPL